MNDTNIKLNVMLVDDSILILRILEDILKELGHSVVAKAKNGKEAIELYKQHNPDMLLLDITMPGEFNGIEVCRQIKSNYPDGVIIMCTSHGQESMVRDAIKAGAKSYILKPVNKLTVTKHIEQIFSKPKA